MRHHQTVSSSAWTGIGQRSGPPPPSGRQIELSRGKQAAIVTEVGATLRSYRSGEMAHLDGFSPGEMCDGGRGQPLVPWPNRLADGSYRFREVDHQLPLDEPENHNAIHGLVRWAAWAPVEVQPHRAVMSHVLHPRPGYPFTLGLDLAYELVDGGLRVELRAANLGGGGPLPFGAGFHPYLTVGTSSVDSVVLSLPGRTRLETDQRGIPVGSSLVEGTSLDFRGAGRAVGPAQLDDCFAELERDREGIARAVLSDPATGRSLRLWVDRSFTHLMVFSGDTLPAGARRRSLAVEPMTCPPNALRSGEGLTILEPGAETTARWGIEPG